MNVHAGMTQSVPGRAPSAASVSISPKVALATVATVSLANSK